METKPETDISQTLGIDEASGPGRKIKHKAAWIVAFILAALVAVFWFSDNGKETTEYKTRPAQQGNLIVTVSATGNLQPTNQVDVGSELSGIIRRIEVDFNDHVTVGQVLANLDTDRLNAQVLQSRATLESSRAKVLQAEATVSEKKIALSRLKKVQELSNGKVPSQSDLDAAEAALARALADEASARALVSQAQAVLEENETNLKKTLIRSPINGIVLSRNVEPGQTVAASLQAPVLFTLAEDLTRMELHVDVDEADVGAVKVGQEATFTVDAYPNRTFPAVITQVRYGVKTSGGVVTYETVLRVDNSDLLLRPGMTATADIVVRKLVNALLVPNAALRFTPQQKEGVEKQKETNTSFIRKMFPRPPRTSEKRIQKKSDQHRQQVWTLQDKRPVAITVITGSTDGNMTEITKGEIIAGTELIVDAISKKP
jgi:HlyD family secretion protein